MRKPDEILLYTALRLEDRARRGAHITTKRPITIEDPEPEEGKERGRYTYGAGFALPGIARALGIPVQRAASLLAKWDRQGFWDYGVSLRAGWFTPDAPDFLTPQTPRARARQPVDPSVLNLQHHNKMVAGAARAIRDSRRPAVTPDEIDLADIVRLREDAEAYRIQWEGADLRRKRLQEVWARLLSPMRHVRWIDAIKAEVERQTALWSKAHDGYWRCRHEADRLERQRLAREGA